MIVRNKKVFSYQEFRLFLEEISYIRVRQEFLKMAPAGIPEIIESGVKTDTLKITKITAQALNPIF